jgi:flagellar hook-associated protein 3 FlgL
MERISTLANNQAMLAEFMRAQRSLLEAQREVSTEKKIHEFSDEPGAVGGLLAARATDAVTADYEATTEGVKSRLDLQDTHLEAIATVVSDLKQALTDALANDNGGSVRQVLDTAYSRVVSVLNTQIDGKYIYGGTRQDVPPVTARTLGQLVAAPDVDSVFQNNNVVQSARVANNQTISFGQLASEIGSGAFQVIRDLAALDAGAQGPFATAMTDAQSAAITAQLTPLDNASAAITLRQSENGSAFKTAESVLDQHADTRMTLASMISDIEDADMAEAITKVNNAQFALQASAQTFTSVQRMSLLDYL